MLDTLQTIFSPHGSEEFDRAFVEHQRLYLRTDQRKAFQRLLPWSTLNTLPAAEHFWSGAMRAVRKVRNLPLEMVTVHERRTRTRRLAAGQLQSLCHQGLSLAINGIEKMVPEICAMNALVERHVRALVHTNAYISFGRDSAFKTHWDDHNVLIMQIHGRKRWWCYGQPILFPVSNHDFPNNDMLKVTSPEWEGVLEPGDILYVPRGEIHRAEVFNGENSVHLTVTIEVPRGDMVVRWLGERLLRETAMRKDVTPMIGAAGMRAQEEQLKKILLHAIDELDLAEFLDDSDRQRRPATPLNLGFSQNIQPGLWVQPALVRRVPLPSEDAGILRFGDVTVPLTAMERNVLALLLERDALQVMKIQEIMMKAGYEMAAVTEAIAGLARKSLVFLFPEDA